MILTNGDSRNGASMSMGLKASKNSGRMKPKAVALCNYQDSQKLLFFSPKLGASVDLPIWVLWQRPGLPRTPQAQSQGFTASEAGKDLKSVGLRSEGCWGTSCCGYLGISSPHRATPLFELLDSACREPFREGTARTSSRRTASQRSAQWGPPVGSHALGQGAPLTAQSPT